MPTPLGSCKSACNACFSSTTRDTASLGYKELPLLKTGARSSFQPLRPLHSRRVCRPRTVRCFQILDIPSSGAPTPNNGDGSLQPQPTPAEIPIPNVPAPPAPVPPFVVSICTWYDKCLTENPLLTKSWTALAGFIIGDLIAQSIEGKALDNLNVARCLRLGSYGYFIDAPVQHYWYRFLDRTCWPDEPTSSKAVLAKTALDQLVWSPMMTCIFFTWLRVLEGRPEAIVPTLLSKVIPTLAANYLFWPLVHIYNFKYIPTEYRVLYNQVMCIAWIGFLSFLTHRGFHLPGFTI